MLSSPLYPCMQSPFFSLLRVAHSRSGILTPCRGQPAHILLPILLLFSYFVCTFSVFPGATPDTGVLETFSNITGNSYTFTVNFATG